MADKTLNARIKQKYDTAANWQTNNPILLAGEIGVESDTGLLRVGDGERHWNDLNEFITPAQYIYDGAGIAETVIDPETGEETVDFSNQTSAMVISELKDADTGETVNAYGTKYTAITRRDSEDDTPTAPSTSACVWLDCWESE